MKRESLQAGICQADELEPTIRSIIGSPLTDFNLTATGRNDRLPIAVSLRDEKSDIVGGMVGHTGLDWLFIDMLFVPETLRYTGVGAKIIHCAESGAIKRGCHGAWLDTYEFQAKAFYEKLGYRVFGELPGYPAGFCRYFMQKALKAERG